MSKIPPKIPRNPSLEYFGGKRTEATNPNVGKTADVPSVFDLVTVEDISPLPAANSNATKKTNSMPGAYSQQPGRESVLLVLPDKSVLVRSNSRLDVAQQKKRGRDSSPPRNSLSLPEAIPITAEVVEAEEAREKRASIRSTIFHQEVHQQREYYGVKLAELEAEKEALQAKIKTASIQATIFQAEHQQQRNYYEARLTNAARENQKLKRTIRKMESAQEELEAVIRAREVDRARQEVYALRAQMEQQMALVEQANEVKLQLAMNAKDQELSEARKEIEQLRRQLASSQPAHGDEDEL